MAENADVDADRSAADTGEESAIGDVTRAGAAALVLSLVVNAAVTTVARMAEVGEGLEAMQYQSVLVLTAAGVVGATVVYAALSRLTSRPDRNFVIVAAIVLALSIVPDVTYIPSEPGGSLTAGIVLASMHVLTAVIAVWLLVDRGQVRQSPSR